MKFSMTLTMKFCVALIAFSLVASDSISAQTVLYDFDTDEEGWRFDFGTGGTAAFDGSENSPGSAGGALKLTFDFPGNGIAFTGDAFGSQTDVSALGDMLSYDVKVDLANSSQDAFGTYGFAQFVSRETDGYTWGNQPGYNLDGAGGEWQTVSLATTGNGGLDMTSTRAFTFQIFGGGNQDIQGPVNVWIDNIRVTAVPEPGALSILGMATICLISARRRRLS